MAELDLGTRRPARWPTTSPVDAHVDQAGAVVIEYPDQTRRLHRVWARHWCPCSQCGIAQSAERRYFLGRVEAPPAATDVAVEGSDVVIEWSDGHRSRYTPAWLTEVTGQARRMPGQLSTWDASAQVAEFDANDVLGDPHRQQSLCEAFERWGAVKVVGLGTSGGESAEFVEALGAPLRVVPFDRIHDVLVDPNGYNVAHTDEAVPPHNDFPSYVSPPSGQALHMLVNEASGGDSILVDGFHVLHQLGLDDPEVIEVLARTPVAHRQFSATVETWSRQPLVRRDWAGRIVALRFSNQLMQPLDPEDPDLDAFYRAYHRLAHAVSDPANQARLRLESGQMLMVHGHRVLHARSAFDARGRRHLQDVYFEADDIWARGAMLRGDRPEGTVIP